MSDIQLHHEAKLRAVVVACLLAACGSDPPRPRPVSEGTVPIADALRAEPIDAAAVVDGVDLDAAMVSVPTDAATVQCFCFSWVHLDENGEYCYPTRPTCDAEFRAFGRETKIACKPEQRQGCGRYACRGAGAECFRL